MMLEKERLELILRLANLGYWDFRPDAVVMSWSPRAKELYGLKPEDEVSYDTFVSALHVEDRDRVADVIGRTLRGLDSAYEVEYRTVGILDGRTRTLVSAGHLLRDDDGQPQRLVGVSRDVTEERTQRDWCLSGWRFADQASEAKSRFIANVSHEMRTPLGIMIGFAELALDPNATNEDRERSLRTIKRNGESLLALVNEVLDLSKVEADKMEVEWLRFELAPALIEVCATLQLGAVEKSLELDLKFEGLLPERAVSDAKGLHQILMNVVGNAVKFTARGKVSIVAKLEAVPVIGEQMILEICVHDSGPGITAAYRERLFQPFSQAETSTTREFGGTGLGLAISKRLAIALHGDLALVSSEPNVGTVFCLRLPVGPYTVDTRLVSLESLARIAAPVTAAERDRHALAGLRVLVVDDMADNRVLVSRYLKGAGANVDTAENGLQAVEMAGHGAYDVVLMDIQMPIMDGYRAAEALRKDGCETPLIAVTAYAMSSERDRCLNAGFDDHFTKPIDRNALIREVAAIAASSHHHH